MFTAPELYELAQEQKPAHLETKHTKEKDPKKEQQVQKESEKQETLSILDKAAVILSSARNGPRNMVTY